MNPVLRIIYSFLKFLVLSGLKLFYSNVYEINKKAFGIQGPGILISNHPNTLIDALMVASRVKKPVYFLGHAGLFQHPVSKWFFSTFYTIPIERPQDTGGKPLQNDESFRKCVDHLENKGLIFIAPEGGSEMERNIRRIKTGTARIALAAEKENDYSLGVTVLPVGLTYEAPPYFQSSVIVHAGEPIDIRSYKDENEADHRNAVRKITDKFEETIRSLTVNASKKDEPLLHLFEAWLKSNKIQGKEAFHRSKEFIRQLRNLPDSEKNELITRCDALLNVFDKVHFPVHRIPHILRASNNKVWNLVIAILGFPLFLFGFLNNLVPAAIPLIILKRVELYIGYHSTVKIVLGIFLFPIFYAIQTSVVLSLFGSWPLALFYLVSLCPSGYFAWYYMLQTRSIRAIRQLNTQNPDWKNEWRYFSHQFEQMI